MKLWKKNGVESTSEMEKCRKMVEDFTVGNDTHWDHLLAAYDVKGSMAHTEMLYQTGMIGSDDRDSIQSGLAVILTQIEAGSFKIEPGMEDVHSQVESMLTKSIGEAGKKLHTARSRNDQSLLDIKLYLKDGIKTLMSEASGLFDVLMALSETHKEVLLPGYTHTQVAMPSSFGLWFAAWAESLCDDAEMMQAAYKVADKNPLGSAAGFGSSFPVNRELVTSLLGFSGMNINSVYAQMTRGKTEKLLAFAMSSLASTLSRMASDLCLYVNANYRFMRFPEHLCTGSSIMPHKRNPDVFELIRARCARIQALPNELTMLGNNLSSGYHRDMQLTKDCLFPAVQSLKDCLSMAQMMLKHVEVNTDILNDDRYAYLFTVEAVNALVQKGHGFRDAYTAVAESVINGTYRAPEMQKHSHTGSLGNLGNEQIRMRFEHLMQMFKSSE